MKPIQQFITESSSPKANLADKISMLLSAAGMVEGVNFKFDKDTLFAKDMQSAQDIADELGDQYEVTISDQPRQSDRYYKIAVK